VRWGGTGAVVVLIHGYAENSDSWAPLAADLMKDHTVVVPDLRGIGRSSKPTGGYDKKTQAKDIRAVVTALGFDRTFVVAHDIGNMVAYAYAAMYPDKVERLVVMDAPIPGIEPWNTILLNPVVWHFNFHGPDAERLVAGRERIYFDRGIPSGQAWPYQNPWFHALPPALKTSCFTPRLFTAHFIANNPESSNSGWQGHVPLVILIGASSRI
jgi:pimeloyl-ACP methyl ester carboxylesterase